MMRPINQKLVSSPFRRFIGYALLSVPLTIAFKCGSLLKEYQCIEERSTGVDKKNTDIVTNCAKPVTAKIISSSPANGASNVSISNSKILIEVENGNKGTLDPNNFVVNISVDNNAAVYYPSSALSIISNPSGGKYGSYYLQINTDNTVFNQTNPNSPLNTPYGARVTATITNGDFSGGVTFTMVENPANQPDIDNDLVYPYLSALNQLKLNSAFNNYIVKTINLSAAMPVTDYVFSKLEGNSLFYVTNQTSATRGKLGDSLSTNNTTYEIDLTTGTVTSNSFPQSNFASPAFTHPVMTNVMQTISSYHKGQSTTMTTANPPADWRIKFIVTRRPFSFASSSFLASVSTYNGGESQASALPVSGNNLVFEGDFPTLTLNMGNSFIVYSEPGKLVKLVYDFNSAGALNSKVSVQSETLLTEPAGLKIPYQLIEDQNIPGQFLLLYIDNANNVRLAKYDASSSLVGTIPAPNNTVYFVQTFKSQPVENAIGFYDSSKLLSVYTGANFGLGISGASAYSYTTPATLSMIPTYVAKILAENVAIQNADAATKSYNRAKTGYSVVDLTTNLVTRYNMDGTIIGATTDISADVAAFTAAVGGAGPTQAKVIENNLGFFLILRGVDGTGNNRVRITTQGFVMAPYLSPALKNTDMMESVGSFDKSGTPTMMVTRHDPSMVGVNDFILEDSSGTQYAAPNTGATLASAGSMMLNNNDGSGRMLWAVPMSTGLRIYSLLLTNIASAPVLYAPILNNLNVIIGGTVAATGTILSMQASAKSNVNDAQPHDLFVLLKASKSGVMTHYLLNVDANPNSISYGNLIQNIFEWTSANFDAVGFKRLTNGAYVLVDNTGRTYHVGPVGGESQRYLAPGNILNSNLIK